MASNYFTKPGFGRRFEVEPSSETSNRYIERAKEEINDIWARVEANKNKLSTESLTVEEYEYLLNEITKDVNKLREGKLDTFVQFDNEYPRVPVETTDNSEGFGLSDDELDPGSIDWGSSDEEEIIHTYNNISYYGILTVAIAGNL